MPSSVPTGSLETFFSHPPQQTAIFTVAFFLNLGFTLLEIAGGIWTNSIAILTDTVHDLGDSISLGLAWYFDRLSEKGRTPRHTYSYRRYRLFGGLISRLLFHGVFGLVLWHSFARLFEPAPVNAPGVMGLAIKGVESVHHIHCWSIDGESHVLSAHVVHDSSAASGVSLKKQIHALLDPGAFEHITLELELENLGESCVQAQSGD